jgi:hypothetical protein
MAKSGGEYVLPLFQTLTLGGFVELTYDPQDGKLPSPNMDLVVQGYNSPKL